MGILSKLARAVEIRFKDMMLRFAVEPIGCHDGRVNGLPIMDNRNDAAPICRPDETILDGSWMFPEAQPIN